MDSPSLGKQDTFDRSGSLLPSSSLPFPSNVSLCYPPQPSPLSDGSQSTGSYLVPPPIASPSGCLTMPPQQMYSNYPSPYYRSMLSSQQSYYSSILPTPGHHSSAFYGTFYNTGSPSVYSGTGQPSLNPINYYSPSLYMQNHETMWNPSSQTNHVASKRSYPYETNSPLLPAGSKVSTTSSSLLPQPPSDDYPDESTLSLAEPINPVASVPEPTTKDSEFQYSTLPRPHSKAESIESLESSVSKESLQLDSEESEETDKEDLSSSFSSTSFESYTNDEIDSISNEHVLDEVPEEILQDNSFGEIQHSKDYEFADEDLQCLLCNNFDHLIPRLDISIKLEPVVGENISKSVLLCTQCDLMLERYLSLEKEVQQLQLQIQSMYQNNKQLVHPDKDIERYCQASLTFDTHTNQDLCLSRSYSIPPLSSPLPATDHFSGATEANSSAPSEPNPTSINPNQLESPATESLVNTEQDQPIRHQCGECGRRYADRKSLQRHLRTHSGKFEQHCDECAETFSTRSSWKKHQRFHNEKMLISCEQCPLEFERRSHYLYHVKVKHSSHHFKCQACDKTFISNGSLKTHMRIHTGEKPFVCQSCGKGFNVNSNLIAHVPRCTGQLPFKCQICSKGFGSKSLFRIHVKAHEGEFAVKCDECGMGFSKKSHLTAHQRTHTKEKPFQCPICSKCFASLSNCNSHAKTHSNDRKYVCEICGKKFPRRQGLQTHLNRHSGVKPYRCTHLNCDKTFYDPSNLTNHKKIHKNDPL